MIKLNIKKKHYAGLEELFLLHTGTEVSEATLSELQPFKASGNYMGGMQKWPNCYLTECMCIVSHDSADTQK